MSEWSHIDLSGRASMVDVTDKNETVRVAVAEGSVHMKPDTLGLVVKDGLKKGDILGVAKLAGIMAAKKTSQLIPLCHPLPISGINVDLVPDQHSNSVNIKAVVKVTGKTGVEMEALTAVSVAALTVYDMAKAVDRDMEIKNIRLVYKSGGKSGVFSADT